MHHPRRVFISLDTLLTLDQRELKAGLAEVIKYGIITDEGLFSFIEERIDDLLACDLSALKHIVERSCRIKAPARRRSAGHWAKFLMWI